MLSNDENMRKLLLEWGTGPTFQPTVACAHYAIEKCAQEDPFAIAIQQGDFSVSYAELDERATEIALKLTSQGVKPGNLVSLVTTRSIEMVCGIFGILKAGAAYVPVDATMPLGRIRYILETVESAATLYNPNLSDQILSLLENPISLSFSHPAIPPNYGLTRPKIPPNSPAYVIFTSGSTGKPKGVVISHASLSNFCLENVNHLDARKGDRIPQLASISFDLCVAEIFLTLTAHATLILREQDDFFGVFKKINKLFCTPATLSKLNQSEYSNLELIAVGGEPLTKSLQEEWADKVELRNCYGPTEATVMSSASKVSKDGPITIGKPLANTFQYILDENMELVPVGVAGELYIGGKGVALGYYNLLELTAKKFPYNKFLNDGSKMFKSGDICKWTQDGELQIVGRKDDMVKIKGYRIELDEVNLAISKYAQVKSSCVIAKNGKLVAFVSPASVNLANLQTILHEELPFYMIPSKIVRLDEFPLTTNEKVTLPNLRLINQHCMLWSSI
jgi:iturin family lipopeptide synthetase B